MTYPLPPFPDSLRDRAREAAHLGAKYIRQHQVWHTWPYWTADAGRIAHNVNIKDVNHRPILSLTWDSARSAQACLSAYKVTGDPETLDTARRAMEYVKVTQIFSPEFPQHRGSFCEEVPQSNHIAARDVIEAVQGFINIYQVTREPVYVQRAVAAADWLFNQYMTDKGGWPHLVIYHRENDRAWKLNDFTRIIMAAVVLPFSQLDAIRDTTHYTSKTAMAIDWLIETAIEADGSLRMHDGTDVGHHAAKSGPLAQCFVNDDGAGVSLIAAYRATKNEKYREAVLRYGQWWLRTPIMPETYAAIPSALLFLLDMYRFTSDQRYADKASQYIEATLKLQYRDEANPRLHGGFIGHDGEKDINPTDYLSLRTTMYSTMALSKVAAADDEQWNMAYSGFGW